MIVLSRLASLGLRRSLRKDFSIGLELLSGGTGGGSDALEYSGGGYSSADLSWIPVWGL